MRVCGKHFQLDFEIICSILHTIFSMVLSFFSSADMLLLMCVALGMSKYIDNDAISKSIIGGKIN